MGRPRCEESGKGARHQEICNSTTHSSFLGDIFCDTQYKQTNMERARCEECGKGARHQEIREILNVTQSSILGHIFCCQQ